MAEQVTRTCDVVLDSGSKKGEVCGDRVPADAPTVIGLGKFTYEVDLCEKHSTTLTASMEPFISVARPMNSKAGKAVRAAIKGKSGVFTTKDVRVWLKEQGIDVPDTGRLPKEYIDRYSDEVVKK